MKPGRIPLLLLFALSLCACKWAYGKVAETLRYVGRHDNGVTSKEGTLVDGKQEGPWTLYYQDGRKRSEGSYHDDHQVGPWRAWHENGRLEWQGSYGERGGRTGAWTFFFDNGQRRADGRFADDLEQGRWTFWNRDGQLERSGDFLDARMVGYWSFAGAAEASGLSFDGNRVGPWREAGKEVAYPLPAGLQLVRDCAADGAVRRTGLLRDGKPVGGWASFGKGGELLATCVFRDGAPQTFCCVLPGGGEVEGAVAGNELIDWSERRGEVRKVLERAPLPPLPPGGAAEPEANAPADERVAVALAVLRAPSQPVAAATAAAPAAPAAPAQPVAAADVRLPPPRQQGWTVLESKELEDNVKRFELGAAAAPPVATGRYAIPKSLQGTPRRRADLEGHELPLQELRAPDGSVVKLADYRGKKRVLLVVLRGFFGQVCVYCVAQTEALARSRTKFDDLDLEVLILYPGPESSRDAFLAAYEETFDKGPPPYRVFYDPDLQLVKQLGIEGGDLAYPTSIYVDEQGIVRYAYTGAHRADRPAAAELIKFIRSLDAK